MVSPLLCFLPLGTVLILPSRAWQQPDFILRVTKDVISPDCTPRISAVINGTSPGPLLTMEEGQHYWIRVFNDMTTENLTMHWHGFSQYGSPFSDGTPMAAQWPIPPHHFFDYEFQLESGFYGTYFYHSHVGMQPSTTFGPIIVNPKYNNTSPVLYDEEIVMVMSDGYHQEDEAIVNGLMNTTLFTWIGEPQALLVNGNALASCNASMIPNDTSCSTDCGWDRRLVKPSTRYRVRVIGATILSQLELKLQGHHMVLFEADGTYLDPLPIDSLQIHSGQRYSVLIETPANPAQMDYWWNVQTIWRSPRTYGAAVWSYNTSLGVNISQTGRPANLSTIVPLQNETFDWVNSQIAPYHYQAPPTQAEVSRRVTLVGDQIVKSKSYRWVVNNRTQFAEDNQLQIPFLVQYYSVPESQRHPNYTLALENGGLDPINNLYPARLGEVLDVVVQNLAGPTGLVEAHPWHFHAAKYWDMGSGPGEFSYEALNASLASSTGKPYRRDTSIVYAGPGPSFAGVPITPYAPGGWRLFRVTVTDPGAWVFHCHITPHMAMGMQTMFLNGAEHLPPLPPGYAKGYLTFGGGAFGNDTYDPGMPKYFNMMRKKEKLGVRPLSLEN